MGFRENLLMRGACFIVVALLVLALLVELSVQQDDSLNSCERKTSCKKCIEKSTCVWCADRKKCEKGNAFGGAGCSDYHWGQCSMPQAIIIVLCILGCCCCLCLHIVLWAFRGVCCPKSWQSKLPKWDKKMRFEAELRTRLVGGSVGRWVGRLSSFGAMNLAPVSKKKKLMLLFLL